MHAYCIAYKNKTIWETNWSELWFYSKNIPSKKWLNETTSHWDFSLLIFPENLLLQQSMLFSAVWWLTKARPNSKLEKRISPGWNLLLVKVHSIYCSTLFKDIQLKNISPIKSYTEQEAWSVNARLYVHYCHLPYFF